MGSQENDEDLLTKRHRAAQISAARRLGGRGMGENGGSGTLVQKCKRKTCRPGEVMVARVGGGGSEAVCSFGTFLTSLGVKEPKLLSLVTGKLNSFMLSVIPYTCFQCCMGKVGINRKYLKKNFFKNFF